MTIRLKPRVRSVAAVALGFGLALAGAPGWAGNLFGVPPRMLPAVPQSTDTGHYELGPDAMMTLFPVTPPPCAGPALRSGGRGFGAGGARAAGAPCSYDHGSGALNGTGLPRSR